MSNYRPKDWKNPWGETLALSPDKQTQYLLDNIYEAGADEMLGVLRDSTEARASEMAHRAMAEKNNHPYEPPMLGERIGRWVFIPDEE